ncbi:MAG: response regulator FixJ [Rhodocyclaceae bacterium]
MNTEAQAETPVIYVVDDEPAVRDALRLLFQSVGLVVRGYATAMEFLEQPLSGGPGCLVSDLRMPIMGGLELLQALRSRGSTLPAVIISGHGDVKLAVRALKYGAADFIEKPFDDQDLLDAVNAALAAFGRGGASDRAECERNLKSLTAREREVLHLVVAGKSNKLIARALEISTRTVEAHRARLMQKLGVGSIAELVGLAIRCGLTPPSDDERLGNHRSVSR